MKNVKNLFNYDILVNKNNKLALNQVPTHEDLISFKTRYCDDLMYLESETYSMWEQLKKDALSHGYILDTDSTFRTYQEQVDTMNEFIDLIGEEKARLRVSEPLTSEHHLGLAIDIIFIRNNKIIEGDEITETDIDYQWVLANLSNYGFILRYPKNSMDITGVMYEPWHIRYVGIELAKYLEENNLLLEEYWLKMNKMRIR